MAPRGTRSALFLVDIFCVMKSFAAALLGTRCEGYDERWNWPDVKVFIVML